VSEAKGDINKLVELIDADFPSFRDVATLDGHKIYFWKRAQIFGNDVRFTLGFWKRIGSWFMTKA